MIKVLIVDDDPQVAAAMRRLLQRRGFEVLTSICAAHALTLLEAFAPDVVVSDFKMPGMDGVELLAEVEKQRPTARRILLSGHADLADTPTPYVFMSKPWDDEQLVRACRGEA